jgi:hypothetical protein
VIDKQELRLRADRASKPCQGESLEICANIDALYRVGFASLATPAAIIALLDELEACKADAERYRWLREQEAEHGVSVVSISQWLSAATCVAVTFVDGSFVDYEIDKARGMDGKDG